MPLTQVESTHSSLSSPQGCVLRPLDYTFHICHCASAHTNRWHSVITLVDDTAVGGLISSRWDCVLEVEHLLGWCAENHLLLNATKTGVTRWSQLLDRHSTPFLQWELCQKGLQPVLLAHPAAHHTAVEHYASCGGLIESRLASRWHILRRPPVCGHLSNSLPF